MVKDIQVIVLFSAVSPLCIKDNIPKKKSRQDDEVSVPSGKPTYSTLNKRKSTDSKVICRDIFNTSNMLMPAFDRCFPEKNKQNSKPSLKLTAKSSWK